MIDFSCDVLVVGCGISVAVVARFLAAEKGKKVIIVDRRSYSGKYV